MVHDYMLWFQKTIVSGFHLRAAEVPSTGGDLCSSATCSPVVTENKGYYICSLQNISISYSSMLITNGMQLIDSLMNCDTRYNRPDSSLTVT